MLDFAGWRLTTQVAFCIKIDEFCIKIDEFCIKTDELCIKTDEFCIKTDEFCIKTDEFCNEIERLKEFRSRSQVRHYYIVYTYIHAGD